MHIPNFLKKEETLQILGCIVIAIALFSLSYVQSSDLESTSKEIQDVSIEEQSQENEDQAGEFASLEKKLVINVDEQEDRKPDDDKVRESAKSVAQADIPTVNQAQPAPAPSPKPKPTTPTSSSTSSSLSFINNVRSDAGKNPLKSDSKLDGWALSHAKKMASECDLYHQNISAFLGQSFSGGTIRSIAENVAYNATIIKALTGLKNSSGHYANMIGDYSHVGIGVVTATSGSCKGLVYTAQVFAK